MKKIFVLSAFVVASVFAIPALADAGAALSPQDFAAQVMQSVQGFGGLPWVAKIAVIVTLIIASMKVSVLDDMVWNRLGKFQAWFAPILGLLGGILSLTLNGGQITLPRAFAYMSAGAGAVILHELLDTVKALPGIGAIWVQLIGVVEGALGGNPQSASDAAKPAA